MPEPTYPPVVAILGPTASGKSALALDLATRLDGVIINVDSMQVYRDLRILTARPDDEDLARAPHRLYGFQAADTPCSAADWRTRALVEIAAAGAAGIAALSSNDRQGAKQDLEIKDAEQLDRHRYSIPGPLR